MAASSVDKALGELTDSSGTGVLGVDNAGSGNAYGVEGVTH